ncbi:hypothetical protein [Paenibacillus sp. R14(2021)]|uniref:hypothetical protein n=1 Tax=Paenibacillus sp. R14(2021) TaxID=2859228 RepID=UPI001C6148D0|nr:hypothetical protein [Paenibacillus sp. R14(2021)]
MVGVIVVYMLTIAAPLVLKHQLKSTKQEKIGYVLLTTIGLFIWISILVNKPFSLPHYIAMLIEASKP